MRDRISRKRDARLRRKARVRKAVRGDAERPRLSVGRSLKHIYAQVVDDRAHRTLAFASSVEEAVPPGTKTDDARWVGARIAERAKAAGVSRVVFDRGGRKYHGRVKALAEAAREGGLGF